MKSKYFLPSLALLGVGVAMLYYDAYSNIWWSIAETVSLVLGGVFLNRALTNKPLLPRGPEAQQMMRNARRKSLLGTASITLFVLSIVFMDLGTDNYFAYGQTLPWLTMVGVLALAGSGAYLLWRYLRFVKYGDAPHTTLNR